MKKIMWKIRYMLDMARRTGMDLRFCWDAATTEIQGNDYWHEYSPHDAVSEELSYWTD